MTSRLKLQDIKQAEKYTLEMVSSAVGMQNKLISLMQIESNEIFATIDHSNEMVSFHVNPEKYNGPTMADHIDKEVGIISPATYLPFLNR